MHAVFIPYGHKWHLDRCLADMYAQKMQLRLYKEGEADKFIFIDCQLRTLPGGAYDLVFPKEFKDMVLTTLRFNLKPIPYDAEREISFGLFKFRPMDHVRKALGLEKAPEDFKTDKQFLWYMDYVSIIPVGIKDDGEITEPETNSTFPGWKHEAI